MFPAKIRGFRDDEVRYPTAAGLPDLIVNDLVPRRSPTPVAPWRPGVHGGRVGRLRANLSAYLEADGEVHYPPAAGLPSLIVNDLVPRRSPTPVAPWRPGVPRGPGGTPAGQPRVLTT